MLLSGSFIADGGEQYITIGNFFDEAHTDHIVVEPYSTYVGFDGTGAYYIDMVSLYDCTGFDYLANAGADIKICPGDSVIIGTDEASNRHYSWFPKEGLSDSTAGRPKAAPLQTTTYMLAVIDEFVQQTTDTITVFVEDTCANDTINPQNLYIPNIFSPNNDGNNDQFYLRGETISDINLKIINRYGEVVFETLDKSQGWDGNCRGRDCPAGVYFYIAGITFKDQEMTVRRGHVTLVR